MQTTIPKLIKKARKRHFCDWCGENIKPNTAYFTWFTFGEGNTARMHHECFEAQLKADLYDEELPPAGTYRRGCWCGEREEHCKCKQKAGE